ncbi:unnamed protein product [Gemmataceae bacterium]|nr:unnamed protein product [Gemmataceae bacterium]VTU00857.1 unnamed protein product [Gemmataceae bacterium]
MTRDFALGAEFAAHAPHHLAGRLGERAGRVGGEDALREPAGLALLPLLERVEVGDDDLRRAEFRHEFPGHDVEPAVVVRGVGREQHAEPVADRDARGDDEEGVGEPLVVRVPPLVQHLPRDEHGHDDGLPAPRRHLERHAEQVGARVAAGLRQVLLDPGVPVLGLLGNFGHEDGGFDRLDLAEEQPPVTLWVRPVAQEGQGDRGRVRPAEAPPLLDVHPDAVDVFRLFFFLVGELIVEEGLLALFFGAAMGTK